MRHVWACRLDFTDDAAAVAPRLRALARYWAALPHGGWPPGHDASRNGTWAPEAGGATLTWRSVADDRARVWELVVDEPYGADTSLRSVTLVQVGSDDDRPFAFLRLSVRASDDVLGGPVNLVTRPPALVADLLTAAVAADGGERLTAVAWSDPAAARVARLITHPHRRLPVVVIDASAGGADPHGLASLLAGLAHVAVSDGDAVARFLGRPLAPPRSGARLLWPDVAPGDPEGEHRSFTASDLTGTVWEVPGWPVARLLFDCASVHLQRPLVTERMEAASARQRIDELRHRTRDELDAVMAEWERDLVALAEARRAADEAEARAREAEARHAALLAGFHDLVERTVRDRLVESPAGRARVPDLAVAVQQAEAQAVNLVFLPSAHATAAGHPYNRPDKVLEDFALLDQVAGRWRQGRLSGSFSQEALAAGLPWSGGVSWTARSRFAGAYTFDWDGRPVVAGPHLRYGAGGPPARICRVYLALDFETRTVIVCHVGRHLPDATSPST